MVCFHDFTSNNHDYSYFASNSLDSTGWGRTSLHVPCWAGLVSVTSFSFAHWEVLIPNYSRGTSLGVFLNDRFLFCCSRLWICHSVLSWPVKLLLRSLSWMSMLLSGFDAFCLISRILFCECVCVCEWCFAVITQRGSLLVESVRDPLSLPGPFPWEVSSLFGKFSSYSIGFFFFSMHFSFLLAHLLFEYLLAGVCLIDTRDSAGFCHSDLFIWKAE